MNEFLKELSLILILSLSFLFGHIINKSSYEELKELKKYICFFYILSFSFSIAMFFYNLSFYNGLNFYLAVFSFFISFFTSYKYISYKDVSYKDIYLKNLKKNRQNITKNTAYKNIIKKQHIKYVSSDIHYKIFMLILGVLFGIIIFIDAPLFLYSSFLFINFILLTSLNYEYKILKIYNIFIYFLLPTIIFLLLKYFVYLFQ